MNRRGFIGGLIGLAGVAAGSKIPQPQLAVVPVKSTVRLRQVLVDHRDYKPLVSEEGERVLIHLLKRNKSLTRKIANG